MNRAPISVLQLRRFLATVPDDYEVRIADANFRASPLEDVTDISAFEVLHETKQFLLPGSFQEACD